MSILENQIKKLQDKKAEVDFLKDIFKTIKKTISDKPLILQLKSGNGDASHIKKKEINDLFNKFIENRIKEVETEVSIEEDTEKLTNEEVKLLKELANRLKSQKNSPKDTTPPPANTPSEDPYNTEESVKFSKKELVNFMKENSKFDGKTVKVNTTDGKIVEGEVIGLNAPKIKVLTETGYRIEVYPRQLEIIA